MDQATMEQLLEKYASAIRGGHATFVPMVRRFLVESGGDFSRQAVEAHLSSLRDRGYADGTIHQVWSCLRRFYNVNGIEWPYRKGEGPVVRELAVHAPALDPKLVVKCIRMAKEGVLDKVETRLLALSTTYGLRRAELATVGRPRDGLIYVETAKHGRQRYHLVPNEILEYIDGPPIMSVWKVTRAWHQIQEKTGIAVLREESLKHGEPWEVGWHAIRRILNRLLIDAGLPIPTVMDFLRWKRSQTSMPLRYYSATVIGEGRRITIDAQDREIDMAVFEVHPFLKVWGGADDSEDPKSGKGKSHRSHKPGN